MPRRSTALIVLSFLGFASLGLPDGVLGVAWPSIRAGFGLPLDALGALLIATTTGYVTSSFLAGALLARISVGALLAISCIATGATLLGYAAAPIWAVMVALGVIAGVLGLALALFAVNALLSRVPQPGPANARHVTFP